MLISTALNCKTWEPLGPTATWSLSEGGAQAIGCTGGVQLAGAPSPLSHRSLQVALSCQATLAMGRALVNMNHCLGICQFACLFSLSDGKFCKVLVRPSGSCFMVPRTLQETSTHQVKSTGAVQDLLAGKPGSGSIWPGLRWGNSSVDVQEARHQSWHPKRKLTVGALSCCLSTQALKSQVRTQGHTELPRPQRSIFQPLCWENQVSTCMRISK